MGRAEGATLVLLPDGLLACVYAEHGVPCTSTLTLVSQAGCFLRLADRPSLYSAPLQHDSAASRPAAELTPAAARSALHECWRSMINLPLVSG